ncbi:MAG: hypothetical protein F4Y61_02880 [Rhodothermaceae bacterium]|nr:hypothetical protein [Rhodothermaceae bacterium]MYF79853.1 hypothetical protein [Chloroflexota bacterium]
MSKPKPITAIAIDARKLRECYMTGAGMDTRIVGIEELSDQCVQQVCDHVKEIANVIVTDMIKTDPVSLNKHGFKFDS